jgi:hypothetical protein
LLLLSSSGFPVQSSHRRQKGSFGHCQEVGWGTVPDPLVAERCLHPRGVHEMEGAAAVGDDDGSESGLGKGAQTSCAEEKGHRILLGQSVIALIW